MEIKLENLNWEIQESEPSIWRYRKLLPKARMILSLGEGLTELRRLGGILIKDETKNPTGSYIDRGSSVMVSCSDPSSKVELEFFPDVTVSLASYLLRSGSCVEVRVDPEGVDVGELLYLSQLDLKIKFGHRSARVSYENPFMLEGFKTIAYEIYEFRGGIGGIVVPSESGVLAYGILKGFSELEEMGLMKLPPIYLAHHGLLRGSLVELLLSRGAKLIEADPRDTIESLVKLARMGIYVKPVSAMAYAVASRLGDDVVALLTGAGLRRWRSLGSLGSLTNLQRRVFSVIREGREMTAYQIWREINEATLQGIYKALLKLSKMGLISSKREMYKKRMKRVYYITGR
ncbi:MAG: pyridoxal-5'-phosphate-dependent protein subunit beta [Candidatus Korarchaeum sp.]|nr:pyridoxal-5'-phosphate-dependent protein subunit beta [Candidatus Korarchaeum sp.]MDW8035037.1 pyridoxal-5'-phosphate-dependent protein subunit beta [Candidatus Korarchaeum sp.]